MLSDFPHDQPLMTNGLRHRHTEPHFPGKREADEHLRTQVGQEEPGWQNDLQLHDADQHPVMRQFHEPDDEKRSVVILHDQD